MLGVSLTAGGSGKPPRGSTKRIKHGVRSCRLASLGQEEDVDHISRADLGDLLRDANHRVRF